MEVDLHIFHVRWKIEISHLSSGALYDPLKTTLKPNACWLYNFTKTCVLYFRWMDQRKEQNQACCKMTCDLFIARMLSCFSHVWFFETLCTVACQAPLSMGFSRQEYWSGLSFASPGDLPDPRIEPTSLMSLAGRFFTSLPPGKPLLLNTVHLLIVLEKEKSHRARTFIMQMVIHIRKFPPPKKNLKSYQCTCSGALTDN